MGAILHDHERGSMEVYPEQDIYSYLRRMREHGGLSLGDLAERMDVRESFLEMLEDGELGRKLGPGYVRSIVVRYGACLGLDSDELLDAVQRQLSGEPDVQAAVSRVAPRGSDPERVARSQRVGDTPPAAEAEQAAEPSPVTEPEPFVDEPQVEVSDAGSSVAPDRPAEPSGKTLRPEDVWSEPEADSTAPERPAAAERSPASGPAGVPPAAVERSSVADPVAEPAVVEGSPVPQPSNEASALRPATSGRPAGPGGMRRAERHLYKTDRRSNVGLKVLRTTAVVLLLVGLAGVTVLAGVWVGTNLLGGEDGTGASVEGSGVTEATAAGATVTTAAPLDAEGSAQDSPAASEQPSDAGAQGAVSTIPAAGDAAAGQAAGGAPAQPQASGYAATFEAVDEVWFEVIDQETEEVLFSGIKQAGETFRVEADGPLLFSTGRPQSLRLNVDGSRVGTPEAFRWLITAEGVSTRE